MAAAVRTVTGTNFAVLADCHIHPGGGPEFPPHVLAALADSHLIVTLGDMGESSGLDQLEAIAPVVGVRGQDDADDPRTAEPALVLKAGHLRIGCVFDATAAGLATSSDPFVPAPDIEARCEALFGMPIDLLLHAATHKAGSDAIGARGKAVNPGSAVLPAEGRSPTFVRVELDGDSFDTQIVFVG
jgi:predicted phosphodiesterase